MFKRVLLVKNRRTFWSKLTFGYFASYLSTHEGNSDSTGSNVYVTTPIYYINAEPHIGHAYTSICADIYARFEKLKGNRVFFQTGTDEHGIKVEQAARRENIPPLDYADKVSKRFMDLNRALNICEVKEF